MWKKIKQNTTAMIGKIKSSNTEEDPKFTEAYSRFNELKTRSKEFIDHAQGIVLQLSKLSQTFDEAYKCISIAVDTIPESEPQEFNQAFNNLSEPIKLCEEVVIVKINDTVLAPVKQLQNQLVELENLKKEHDKMRILLEQNKEKLAKLQQKNKQPAEIQRYQEKVEDKTKKVAEMQQKFIESIDDYWGNREALLQKPMSDMNDIFVEFSTSIQKASVTLQLIVGQELMEKVFVCEQPPAKK
ncbi:hypothetical protein TRFO_25893 [Tritrichomonas foetus]|uniref:BAR domain-containing protein n=1 Tax=Tritrichomonas foetus TaxID=1144522 RepID=A0A1J4K409_9EUKA|nr:hypothetical protein TRFO_25893 [Tritrichomonas foetus]|eukprot:OHT06185.1 hypothetical protein TRFO_25893 [Tritrichomonas foetus]